MPITKDGTPIVTTDAWVASAGPVGPDHWADGRAAIETARAWLDGDDVPKELKAALKRHDGFGKIARWSAEPRVALAFDDGVDAPVVDLVVDAEDEHGAWLIVVDARTDEPFGDTVGDTLVAAVEAGLAGGGTDALGRVTRLAAALLGPRSDDDPAVERTSATRPARLGAPPRCRRRSGTTRAARAAADPVKVVGRSRGSGRRAAAGRDRSAAASSSAGRTRAVKAPRGSGRRLPGRSRDRPCRRGCRRPIAAPRAARPWPATCDASRRSRAAPS